MGNLNCFFLFVNMVNRHRGAKINNKTLKYQYLCFDKVLNPAWGVLKTWARLFKASLATFFQQKYWCI